ncbi:cell division protein FtsA [Moraxella canis]|uniref:Cell division protein FtsA n=1 Tax=Moraxella canis TaxID=90239 RepID=A0A1S9ZQ12_9GAMM|nr:cell division protein FtsA [Moraxella canis]OOR85584.1 cell division protein FtsA [Moraxella canis]
MTLQAVIHISSTAVCTAVGHFETKGLEKHLKVSAVGLAHTDAFFGGRVDNREHLLSAIHKSVREASDMAGLQIISPILCMASPMMSMQNMSHEVVIDTADRMVMPEHICQATQAMSSQIASQDRAPFQMNRQLIFLEDYHVQDAKGLMTDKICVASHVIDMPTTQLNQMISLVEQDDLHVESCLFDGIAGAEYALSEDEKQAGVCFIDIGAGMTKVCIYKDGVLIYSHCLDMGGVTVDMDIAKECGIALADTDSFKRQEGTLNRNKYSPGAVVTYKRHTKHEKTMLRRELNQVIEARYRKLLDKVIDAIDASLLVSLDAGIVLAGGGSSMDGLLDFARNHIGMKARLITNNPRVKLDPARLSDDNIKLLNKHLSDNTLHTAIGALLFVGSAQYTRDQQTQEIDELDNSWVTERVSMVSQLFGQFTAWIKRVF